MNTEILNQVLKIVCNNFEITESKIRMQRSYKRYVFPRQILFYILRKHFNYSFSDIGREFTLHHSTIMHSVKKIKDFVQINDGLTIQALKNIIPMITGFEKDVNNIFIIVELSKDCVNHFGGVDNMVNSIKSFVNSQHEFTKTDY